MSTDKVPPTTHALQPAHRLRLVRSTRKLGALLGETPLLVDTATCPLSATTSRAAGSSSQQPQSSSLGLSSEDTGVSRPLLFLRLPIKTSPTPTQLTSPISGVTFNSPGTPGPVVDEDGGRRRKMAKLTRTLGDNVPLELVFPMHKGRRRAASMTTFDPRSEIGVRRHTLKGTLSHAVSFTSLRNKVNQDVQHYPVPSTDPIPELPSTVTRLWAESSASGGAWYTNEGDGADEYPISPPLANGPMHRQERGWSGEWAGDVENMEDVVQGLRALRLK
ncbi:hypothetical protein B0H10DRAFT_1963757 [Mycena sp. CBHHK59/15]|nr:hypothetical protein B0H10DRAFT_1963757 [Mycena sp. CBHHK59/15]